MASCPFKTYHKAMARGKTEVVLDVLLCFMTLQDARDCAQRGHRRDAFSLSTCGIVVALPYWPLCTNVWYTVTTCWAIGGGVWRGLRRGWVLSPVVQAGLSAW
jgi:hypothetical protein